MGAFDFLNNPALNTTVGGLPSTLPTNAGSNANPAGGTILGMQPANFATVMGMLSQAIAPKDSVGSKLGGVATQMGKSQLVADATQIQDMKNKAFMKEVIGQLNKGTMSSDAAMSMMKEGYTPVDNSKSLLDNTPEGFYGAKKPNELSFT